MNSRPKHTALTEDELEDRIELMLSERIEPSADFTQRVLRHVATEKVVPGPWQSSRSWISVAGAVAAVVLVVIGAQLALPSTDTLTLSEQELSDAIPSIPEVTPAAPISEEVQPDTLYDAEELLENLAPLLNDDHALADLNMLLES